MTSDAAPEALLDECIDRIMRGEEWQSIVHAHPMLAEELRSLASLAEELAGQAGSETLFWRRADVWQRVQTGLAQPPRPLASIGGAIREWHEEAPTIAGMLVASAMSSFGLLAALATGIRPF